VQYYVRCKNLSCSHIIIINFEEFYPKNREEIWIKYPSGFYTKCLNDHEHLYYASDVMARPQYFAASASGAMLGAILSLVHPIAGVIGIIGGGTLARNTEEKNAELFNRS